MKFEDHPTVKKVRFLAKEERMPSAVLRRRICVQGSMAKMSAFFRGFHV